MNFCTFENTNFRALKGGTESWNAGWKWISAKAEIKCVLPVKQWFENWLLNGMLACFNHFVAKLPGQIDSIDYYRIGLICCKWNSLPLRSEPFLIIVLIVGCRGECPDWGRRKHLQIYPILYISSYQKNITVIQGDSWHVGRIGTEFHSLEV